MVTVLFATATESEELPHWIWVASMTCFFLAFGIALIVAIIRMFWDAQRWLSTSLALAAFTLGLPLVVFTSFVHHLDFVVVEMDGTRASEPFWTALWVPCLPLEIAMLVLLFHHRVPRQKVA